MGYLKKFLALLTVLGLLTIGLPAFADMTDEATLGGQDSSDNYRWRVTSDGKLIPGADDTYDIGDGTHEVQDIYIDGTAYIDEASLSGNMLFQTNIYASGHASGATTIASTASPLTTANLAFGLVQFENGSPGAHPFPDGVIGKMVTFVLLANPAYIIIDDTPGDMTKTGWVSITFDDAYDRITMLWLDNSTGWIIVNNDGCAIAY